MRIRSKSHAGPTLKLRDKLLFEMQQRLQEYKEHMPVRAGEFLHPGAATS